MKNQFSLPAMGARLKQEFARIEQKLDVFDVENLKQEL